MKRPRRGARVVVKADDPALRSLIVERLSAGGDLDVGVWDENGADPDAVVDARDGDHGLTPREIEVLALLAEGLANKEIAQRLGFSAHTAKFHVDSILRKFTAANRAEAVMEGIRRGAIGV
jgi:DNA-binding CsgD family transcriptional regulator